MTEYRAVFDAEVTFRNGGGLQVQGFRLDVPGEQVTDAEVAALLIRHLGLLMADEVRLRGLSVIAEPHRGARAEAAAVAPPRLVDLSHPISAGMITYPGLPGPEISAFLSHEDSRDRYAPGTEFGIGRISMVGNTGTYVDSPYHRFPGAPDLAGVPLESLAGLEIVVIRLDGSAGRAIGPNALAAADVESRAVLLHTGWSRHWGTGAYGGPAPFLSGAAAEMLASRRAALVGIDSVNIDDVADGERPAHTALLGAGIPVLEHLTRLDDVPVIGAVLHAAPPAVHGMASFPVRAYAVC